MYTKITDEFPQHGKTVMTYNGETTFKNKYGPDGWAYELKYPITHWTYLPDEPDFSEVVEVRDHLVSII